LALVRVLAEMIMVTAVMAMIAVKVTETAVLAFVLVLVFVLVFRRAAVVSLSGKKIAMPFVSLFLDL